MNPIILADHNYSYLERKLIKQSFLLARGIDNRNKSRHVSFLVQRNKIVSAGVNDAWKTHPDTVRWNYRYSAIHSEFDCLVRLKSSIDLKKCIMYNLRISRANQIVMSKPCRRCDDMLQYYGIECKYTNEQGEFTKL